MTPAAPRFRLDPRVPPARAVRRLSLELLDHALTHARRGDARGIHEARRACKRLRALLRLMRSGRSKAYRTENRRLRDAARALSPQRDADVLRATARSVGLGLAVGTSPSGGSRAPAARAVQLLQAQRRAVGRWPSDALSRAALEAAVVEGYRRARRAGRQARRRPRADLLHEWRKQVKHHCHQCEAVATLWPHLLQRARALDDLGEILGRHHDVEVLALALQRQPHRFGAPEAVLPAARRLRREQEHLAARALRAGAKLFRDDPRDGFGREARR